MSRKLYIFAIGGTGSRVLKSLVMLFAGGLKLPQGFDMLVPVIIDPDTANGDLNRTKDILRLYQEIRRQINEPDDFFAQEVKTIDELMAAKDSEEELTVNADYFQYQLRDVEHTRFKDYIGFDRLSETAEQDDKNFVRLFYSQNNLNSNLDVGFKGNPNMGAVVLNQFVASEEFKRFAQTFKDDDAIFIINSIFGGTGAAGFPLLLKTLRSGQMEANEAKIKEAGIGGITYLPYFSLTQQGEINADSFEDKAKFAIDYYNRTIIKPGKVNALYFVGNRGSRNFQEYAVGGREQRNKAHFLELAGALAVVDFCENITKWRAKHTKVKEFGIERDDSIISFESLNIDNARTLFFPLTKFKLYTNYMRLALKKTLGKVRWSKRGIFLSRRTKESPLSKKYFESIEYKNQVKPFNEYFDQWLKEMEENAPSFRPFRDVTFDSGLKLVRGKEPNSKSRENFALLDQINNDLIEDYSLKDTKGKKHTALLKMFGRSTSKTLQQAGLTLED